MPRPITDIIALTSNNSVKVPPTAPYTWNNGDHDIPRVVNNVPIIAMAYCHESAVIARVSAEDYAAAKVAMDEATGTDAEVAAAAEVVVDYLVHRDFETYVNWYIVLVACMQVRELSDANIENFGRMSGGRTLPSSIKKFIHYWADSQERFVDNVGVRSKFVGNMFFEYHTVGSSTPVLCDCAIREFSHANIFTDDEVSAVRAARVNTSDINAARRISDITIIKCRAIHEALGSLPDTWYMARHALSKYSPSKYSAMVKLVRAILEKRMDISDLTNLDEPAILAKLSRLING